MTDDLDRRRLLIAVQLLLAGVSATLMVLAHTQRLDMTSLLALTFLGGTGAALMAPTWQSIVPALVPKGQLRSAVALNSLGINLSRAVGPAAGGLLLAAWGAAFTYGVDLLTYGLVIAALLWWRPAAAAADPLAEVFGGALRTGLRHALANRRLQRVLWRAALFFTLASAPWALLPLVGKQLLGSGAAGGRHLGEQQRRIGKILFQRGRQRHGGAHVGRVVHPGGAGAGGVGRAPRHRGLRLRPHTGTKGRAHPGEEHLPDRAARLRLPRPRGGQGARGAGRTLPAVRGGQVEAAGDGGLSLRGLPRCAFLFSIQQARRRSHVYCCRRLPRRTLFNALLKKHRRQVVESSKIQNLLPVAKCD